MCNKTCKPELLQATEHLYNLVKTFTSSRSDATFNLQDIFRASLEVTYLSQSNKEWALRILTQPLCSCAIRVAVDTGWFRELADGSAKTAEEVAAATNTGKGLLTRFMRVLTAEGIVDEVGIERYKANERTRFFIDPLHADMARNWFDNVSGPLLTLPTYLSNTSYTEPSNDSLGPYAFTYGNTSWKRFAEYPRLGSAFNNAMTVVKHHDRCPLISKYPLLSELARRHQIPQSDQEVLIVDVGGGLGYHLRQFAQDAELMAQIPRGRLVLQDLPHVLPSDTHEPTVAAELANLGIETMPYDFFTPQPVHGAHVYHFSAVFHNWPDHLAKSILLNTIPALRLRTGQQVAGKRTPQIHPRLLIQDYILPDIGASTMQAGFDMTMMAVLCGKERSLREWEELVGSVGLKIVKVWGEDEGTRILECGLVDDMDEDGYTDRVQTPRMLHTERPTATITADESNTLDIAVASPSPSTEIADKQPPNHMDPVYTIQVSTQNLSETNVTDSNHSRQSHSIDIAANHDLNHDFNNTTANTSPPPTNTPENLANNLNTNPTQA